jgi:hypothetical protein
MKMGPSGRGLDLEKRAASGASGPKGHTILGRVEKPVNLSKVTNKFELCIHYLIINNKRENKD